MLAQRGKTKSSQRWGKKQPLRARSGTLSSPLHCLGDYLGKLSDVVFGGVEGTHPAHNRFFFYPHIKKVLLHNLFDGVARDLDEHAVGLNLPNHSDSRNAADFLF